MKNFYGKQSFFRGIKECVNRRAPAKVNKGYDDGIQS
jgi:hypothetical protein